MTTSTLSILSRTQSGRSSRASAASSSKRSSETAATARSSSRRSGGGCLRLRPFELELQSLVDPGLRLEAELRAGSRDVAPRLADVALGLVRVLGLEGSSGQLGDDPDDVINRDLGAS